MVQPLLLTYNLDRVRADGLRALCDRLDIRCRAVLPEEYALPIGALAGIPIAGQAAVAPIEGFDEAMLVICHMLSDQLDALLEGMRASGIRVALKAVLTPANVAWNSRQLHDELAREHAAMRRRD